MYIYSRESKERGITVAIMINHTWAKGWIAIVLNLLPLLFVHHTQCSGMNLRVRNALKDHLNDIPFHQIIRRQADSEMPTAQDRAYCASIENDATCSSGLRQGQLDISLSCGESIEDIRFQYAHCARSENGAYCGSLSYGVSEQYLEGNCSGAVTSNICPSQCRTQLEDFKSKLGCCINEYLNMSGYDLYMYTRLSVNYRLWNLCGVPLPAKDCQNHGLIFNVPANAQNCTGEEFGHLHLAIQCEPTVVQPYTNDLLKDNRCSQIYLNSTKHLINLCSMNSRGDFCNLQIGEFTRNYSNGTLYHDYYVSALNSNCDFNTTDEQDFECSSTCRNELVEVKNALGCCINYYNTSINYPDIYVPPPSLTYRVWEACRVETPGFCESKLSLNSSINSSPNDATLTIRRVQWASTLAAFAMLSIFNLGV